MSWSYDLATAAVETALGVLAFSSPGDLIDHTHFTRGALWIITNCNPQHDNNYLARLNEECGCWFRHTFHGDRALVGWYWVPYPTSWHQQRKEYLRIMDCKQAIRVLSNLKEKEKIGLVPLKKTTNRSMISLFA